MFPTEVRAEMTSTIIVSGAAVGSDFSKAVSMKKNNRELCPQLAKSMNQSP